MAPPRAPTRKTKKNIYIEANVNVLLFYDLWIWPKFLFNSISIDAIWKFKSNAFVLCTMHVPYSQIILHKGKKTPIGLQTKELYNLLKSLRI